MWPQFDFTMARDINRNGTPGETGPAGVITLTGAECLVFFLGGPDTVGADPVGDGFSKNPRNPFAPGGSRIGPFAEFDIDRFRDVDGDGAHEYKDAFPSDIDMPLLYISSYDGQGYNPDVDLVIDGSGVPAMWFDYNGNGSYDPPAPNQSNEGASTCSVIPIRSMLLPVPPVIPARFPGSRTAFRSSPPAWMVSTAPVGCGPRRGTTTPSAGTTADNMTNFSSGTLE